MTTWILVFYMSMGWGNASTGGPAVVDGFTTKARCEAAMEAVSHVPKYDFGYCVPVTK